TQSQARRLMHAYPALDRNGGDVVTELAAAGLTRALAGGLDLSRPLPECLEFCTRAVYYEAMDWLRRRGGPIPNSALRARDGPDGNLLDRKPDPGPGPDALAEQADEALFLRGKLGTLPARDRLLVELRFFQKKTLAEIAEVTGQSVAGVHRALDRA